MDEQSLSTAYDVDIAGYGRRNFMKNISVIVLLLLIIFLSNAIDCAELSSDTAKSTSYYFKDLGYKMIPIYEGENATINFESPYDRAEGEINLYFPRYYLADITVTLNNAILLSDKALGNYIEKTEKISVPLDFIGKGNNTLNISLVNFKEIERVPIELLTNSKIKIIENVSNAEEINVPNEIKPDASRIDQKLNRENQGQDRENAKTAGKGPDLEVTNASALVMSRPVKLSPTEDTNLDIIEVNFTVKNTGSQAVTDKFVTEISLFSPVNETKQVETPRLDPGKSFTETVVFIVAAALVENKPIIIKADADDDIAELDEGNNIRETLAVNAGM
ncbi:MAG: hypothetical protein NTU95_00735 [Methanothrix sp.]|nr:hypothetical protein [Methanothrix sp.]